MAMGQECRLLKPISPLLIAKVDLDILRKRQEKRER
jgi:hypothetical protein